MAISESTARATATTQGVTFAATAPAVDPYLKPESVRKELVSCGSFTLPPLFHGIQPGLDLHGNPKDYAVSVLWIDRDEINRMLSRIADDHPDLALPMAVVRSYMGHLDTSRSEAQAHMSCARGAIERGEMDRVIKSCETALSVFCRWDDSRRLMLR